jgi:pyruvate formate-lyase activating enzyme-like uncharacterized protein
MDAYEMYLNDLINVNRDFFKDQDGLRWINSREANTYQGKWEKLLEKIPQKTRWSFKNTKPWINGLSPGCRLCGEGKWSCLFITGQCNAHCFYCPAKQQGDHVPESQGLKFTHAEDYAVYLNYFGFKACSFSGGEPMLVFDRLLHFLKIIRKYTSPDIYIWMYTNGIMVTREKLKMLADEGLNEIRFDIGATNYRIDKLSLAKGLFSNLTVEIPSIPNKTEALKELIPRMIDNGVTHLNLHQLRLTRFNVNHLKRRSYIFLHGEAPTVLKSELDALELILHAGEKGWPMGINYCSFQYKNRFQQAGFRNQLALKLAHQEKITENGFIRRLYGMPLENAPDFYPSTGLIYQWIRNGFLQLLDESQLADSRERYAWIFIEFLKIQFANTDTPGDTSDKILVINDQSYRWSLERSDPPIAIDRTRIPALLSLISGKGKWIPGDPDLFMIWKYSFVESGFRNYF